MSFYFLLSSLERENGNGFGAPGKVSVLSTRPSENVNALFRGCCSLAEGALGLPSPGEAERGGEIYFGFKRGMCVSDRCPCQRGLRSRSLGVYRTVSQESRSLIFFPPPLPANLPFIWKN